jgi:Protein of unknown function (DUF1566)
MEQATMTIRKKFNSALSAVGSLAVGLTFVMSAHAVCRTDIKPDTPDSRFVVNANGTVTDNKTQLMWKQCPVGLSGAACAVGTAQTLTWKGALDNSAATSLAGFSDWRVPNIKELESIVERRCYNPSINETVFPNSPSNLFWSSSVYAGDPNFAWVVNFYYGYGNGSVKNNSNYVRLVRSGQ